MAKGGMKKAAAKTMTKGALADALATKSELKKSVVGKLLNGLAEVGAAEVKKAGVFTIPGLARIKTRRKPATKATKRMMFGKETLVKAKPAKTVVKAFAVAALKKTI
jgi:nucleoid DNA-binding protein